MHKKETGGYSHDKFVLMNYHNAKHIKSNANPYLSPHLFNANMEKPPSSKPTPYPPKLHYAQGNNTPTVLPDPTVRPEYLKSSLSIRRPDVPSYSYQDFQHDDEVEPRGDPD